MHLGASSTTAAPTPVWLAHSPRGAKRSHPSRPHDRPTGTPAGLNQGGPDVLTVSPASCTAVVVRSSLRGSRCSRSRRWSAADRSRPEEAIMDHTLETTHPLEGWDIVHGATAEWMPWGGDGAP